MKSAQSVEHPPSPSDVTRILGEVSRGERSASSRQLPVVYAELRRLARARMAHLPAGQTLQPTALVHDAYLRLVGDEEVTWKDRAHFFGAAAMAMRDILVERARRRARIKHGGGLRRIEFDESLAPDARGAARAPQASACATSRDQKRDEAQAMELLALNDALTRLEAEDPRKSQVVMLRYFGGLSIEETATALDLSPATIKREWNFARAWLLDSMTAPETPPGEHGCPAAAGKLRSQSCNPTQQSFEARRGASGTGE